MKTLKNYNKFALSTMVLGLGLIASSSYGFDYESAYGKFGVVSGQPMQCEQVQKITQACVDSCNKDTTCVESCQNISKMQVQSNNLKDCKPF